MANSQLNTVINSVTETIASDPDLLSDFIKNPQNTLAKVAGKTAEGVGADDLLDGVKTKLVDTLKNKFGSSSNSLVSALVGNVDTSTVDSLVKNVFDVDLSDGVSGLVEDMLSSKSSKKTSLISSLTSLFSSDDDSSTKKKTSSTKKSSSSSSKKKTSTTSSKKKTTGTSSKKKTSSSSSTTKKKTTSTAKKKTTSTAKK